MESFVELAKLEEKVMFQYYINKCKFCYGTVMGCITFTLVAMLFGPLLLDQTFPLEIEYPFDVERQPLKTIIYLHHVVLIYQSYIQVCTNVFVALLLWFLVARFDILACKFREIANASEFAICVKQHQHLLRWDVTHFDELFRITRYALCLLYWFFNLFVAAQQRKTAKRPSSAGRYSYQSHLWCVIILLPHCAHIYAHIYAALSTNN